MKTKPFPECEGEGVIEKGTGDEWKYPTCGGSDFAPDDDDDQEIIRTGNIRIAADGVLF